MIRKKFVLLLLVTAVLLAGCNNGEDTPTPTPVGGGDEPIGSPGPDIMVTTLEPITVVDWPYDLFDFWGPTDVPGGGPATPVVPAYVILDGKLISCLGEDFIILKVRNTSGWSFQYLTMGASDGTDSWYVWPKDFWPFHHGGGECPLAVPFTHLGPGEEAFLYLPVDHTFGTTTYSIWVNMCTFVGNPPSEAEHCVLQYYNLTVVELEPWWAIYVRVIDPGVCYFGPGSGFGTLGGLSEDEIVKLICQGEEEGWKIVLHNLYEKDCWFPDEKLSIPDPEVLKALDICKTPTKTPECESGYKWDYERGKCVPKKVNCSTYKTQATCEKHKDQCWWDISPPTYGSCKPK